MAEVPGDCCFRSNTRGSRWGEWVATDHKVAMEEEAMDHKEAGVARAVGVAIKEDGVEIKVDMVPLLIKAAGEVIRVAGVATREVGEEIRVVTHQIREAGEETKGDGEVIKEDVAGIMAGDFPLILIYKQP